MARLCSPVTARCVQCGAELPAHDDGCPLARFERDHGFGGDYDASDEGEQ